MSEDFVVPFDREVYTVGLRGNREFDTPVVRLGFASLAVPASVYDFDVASRSTRVGSNGVRYQEW